jgi:hypothetical protein
MRTNDVPAGMSSTRVGAVIHRADAALAEHESNGPEKREPSAEGDEIDEVDRHGVVLVALRNEVGGPYINSEAPA